MYERAHEEVERILSQHYPPELVVSPEAKSRMDAIIEAAKANPQAFSPERYRYA